MEACPADAIHPEDELPAGLAPALEWNARLAAELPMATTRVVPLADAEQWQGRPGKWGTLPAGLAPGAPVVPHPAGP
ncbi:hypothetical protein GCM10027073_13740 [Streptomyces chlorus]